MKIHTFYSLIKESLYIIYSDNREESEEILKNTFNIIYDPSTFSSYSFIDKDKLNNYFDISIKESSSSYNLPYIKYIQIYKKNVTIYTYFTAFNYSPAKNEKKENMGNYKIGDKVLCRVRPKKRVVFDDSFKNGKDLESKAFEIIGDSSDGSFIILINDSSLASWKVEDHHIKDHHISTSLKGKNAYNIFAEAIGGLAPSICLCDACKDFNISLRDKLNSEELNMKKFNKEAILTDGSEKDE